MHGSTLSGTDGGPTDLRSRRAALRLSVSHVARELRVHPSTVLRWERGERLPGSQAVTALARTLATERSAVAGFFDARRAVVPPHEGVRATGLRALRRRAGASARDVAAELGVPVSTVYNWEHGRARLPASALGGVARHFGLSSATTRRALRLPAPDPAPSGSPLRRARLRRGWSQERLAREVGVSRHLVGAWERGGTPGLWHLRALSRALGVDVARVAGWCRVSLPRGLEPASWRPGELPAVLRDLRAWSGLRQSDLADLCGLSAGSVRAWERGRSAPGAAALRHLEHLYRLPPRALEAAR